MAAMAGPEAGTVTMTRDQFSMLLKPLECWIDEVMDDLQRLPEVH